MIKQLKKLVSVFPAPVIFMFVVIIFFIIAFIALGKSLNFALFGDDWFMFYVIDKTYGPGKTFPLFSLDGYAQPWGVMNISLMIVRSLFGYMSYGYFFVSITLRVIASLAGYIFLSKFIKSKLIAVIASLFILVGYSGIESSNYVLHMNVYLVIIFLFLSLTFLIDSFKAKPWKFILGCLLFALSLAVNPLRSHGLLPFFIIFDLIFSLTIAKTSLKNAFLRVFFIIVSAGVVYKLGFFGSVTPGFIKFDLISQMIKEQNFTFLSAFITNLGKTFLPDLYAINLRGIVSVFGANWYKWVILGGFLIEFFIFLLLSSFMKEKIKSLSILSALLIVSFSFISLVLRRLPRDEGLFSILINSYLGIFLICFAVWAMYVLFISKTEKKSRAWVGMIAGPVVILTSFMVPLLFNPGAIMGSDNRYYTLGLSGVAITIASLLKIISDHNKRATVIFLIILAWLLIFNIRNDRKYMNNLYLTRNVSVTDLMWSNLFGFLPKNYPDKLLIFYFNDKENPGLANNTILFGFPPRMALQYKITEPAKIPTFTNIYEEIISSVTDGKAFLRLGYPQEKISLDQVYAFKFTKNGELLDITNETRKNLKVEIENYEQ